MPSDGGSWRERKVRLQAGNIRGPHIRRCATGETLTSDVGCEQRRHSANTNELANRRRSVSRRGLIRVTSQQVVHLGAKCVYVLKSTSSQRRALNAPAAPARVRLDTTGQSLR